MATAIYPTGCSKTDRQSPFNRAALPDVSCTTAHRSHLAAEIATLIALPTPRVYVGRSFKRRVLHGHTCASYENLEPE
jgi:hypothetical protein